MLGVAGTGLAVAMFFDALKKPLTPNQDQESTVGIEKDKIVTNTETENENETKSEPDENENGDETESKLESVSDEEMKFTPASPQKREEDDFEPRPKSYKDYFLQKRDEWIEQVNRNAEDNSYRGDGSTWDKQMYFMKQAYKRSREATPVDPNIKAAVRLKRLNLNKSK